MKEFLGIFIVVVGLIGLGIVFYLEYRNSKNAIGKGLALTMTLLMFLTLSVFLSLFYPYQPKKEEIKKITTEVDHEIKCKIIDAIKIDELEPGTYIFGDYTITINAERDYTINKEAEEEKNVSKKIF